MAASQNQGDSLPAVGTDEMDVDAQNTPDAQGGESEQEDRAIARIEQLLRTKDDTSRFVALALLKAVLDNQDTPKAASPDALLRLWKAVPVKFLDKLLRAGLNAQSESTPPSSSSDPAAAPTSTAHMRDLAVAVFHTFAVRILPSERRGDARLTGRIPLLVELLLNTPSEATPPTATTSEATSPTPENVSTLILQTLVTLVGHEQGAAAFYKTVDDYSPLIELAPSQPLVLDILLSVWLYGFLAAVDTVDETHHITDTLQTTLPKLVAAFKGTDGVTLLDFITKLLRGALFISSERNSAPGADSNTDLMPSAESSMVWLRPMVGFIRRLAANRPTARSRAAYTYAANTLLQVFPGTAEDLLFGSNSSSSSDDSGSFAHLFINLLLVDLRATLPSLLSQINNKDTYASTASRLASAYDVLNAFVAYLMQSMEDDEDDEDDEGHEPVKLALSADNILRFRTTMSEAMSVTAEYLRDRWDAAISGAMGLHPDARTGLNSTPTGGKTATFSHALDAAGLPLTWDSADDEMIASRDPLVLAAVRTLSLWLREDENTTLRREALGLIDMFVDLYSASESARSQDIRLPVIDALEGISYIDLQDVDDEDEMGGEEAGLDRKAIAVLLEHGVWKMLTSDLLSILESSGERQGAQAEVEAYRGVRIAAFLLPIVVSESSGAPPEEWMDFITRVAAWSGPDGVEEARNGIIAAQCRVAALQLAAQLAHDLRPAIHRRYKHSISALRGLASQMQQSLKAPIPQRLQADLADVVDMLR